MSRKQTPKSNLNPTRLEMYVRAYSTRLKRGETMEDIDQLYLTIGRIQEHDIEAIHEELKKYQ